MAILNFSDVLKILVINPTIQTAFWLGNAKHSYCFTKQN